jgi:signal transduction histidine kinase/ActR/RegA family two-component response regulator
LAGVPWSTLGSDPILRLGALLLLALVVPFVVPLLSPEALATYSDEYSDLLHLPLIVLAFGYGLGRVRHKEHRRFTVYVIVALALWWIVRLSYLVFPYAPGTLAGDITCDLLYALFYFFMILAIETRPHLASGWSDADPTRKLRTTSVAVVMFTMLGYFVFIPSMLNYDFYHTWLPSMYMYVALDIYLAARFFHAGATCGSGLCRRVYALFGLTASCWAVFDLIECLSWANILELPSGNAVDLLWWIPVLLLLVAARLPYIAAGDDEREEEPDARFQCAKPGTLRAVAPQVVVAFLIPSLHLAIYGTGLLDAEGRAARDLLVLVSLSVLGALVLVQQFVLEKGNRLLESELRQVNEQLEQSQRMEAIGRLAGGVAHDFNNLLTAIMGHTGLLLQRLPSENEIRREVERIDGASRRAATLTRQLLAFSRRQVLRPEVIDLNAVVSDMREMLQRMIGEDVALVTSLDHNLGRVRADRGQIEQVIMNLCVNARDAMPNGGWLKIETKNVQLPTHGAKSDARLPRGSQVALTISDTGTGMDGQTLERIFDPFFTTKERAKGTGLGLSSVYGIVRQSGGHIRVDSEPEAGTTFRIYLPRRSEEATASAREAEEHPEAPPPPSAQETVLVVEDEDTLRELACEILEMHGYRVVEACNGQDALRVYERHEGTIDLLLTDVVMPVMGGRELARRLEKRQPGLKVLYVSGYTDETVIREGKLEPGAEFLAKPFSPDELASKIREVLHREEPRVAATGS